VIFPIPTVSDADLLHLLAEREVLGLVEAHGGDGSEIDAWTASLGPHQAGALEAWDAIVHLALSHRLRDGARDTSAAPRRAAAES
jgi:hypothetical protein